MKYSGEPLIFGAMMAVLLLCMVDSTLLHGAADPCYFIVILEMGNTYLNSLFQLVSEKL